MFTSAPAIAVAANRGTEDRTSQERAARKACLKGDYAKGVDILTDLFVDTKDPTYIFNQGRCFEQNRRFEDAIGRFEEYLRMPDEKVNPGDRASAEKHIADCRSKLPPGWGADASTQPPQQPTPLPVPTPASTPQPEPSFAPEVEVANAVPQPTQRRWGLLTAGIVTGVVGLGGVATGLVLNLKANQMATDMEAKPGAFSSAKEDEQKTYRLMSVVGYAGGGACIAVGAALMGFGLRSSPAPSTNVSFLPSLGPGQVGGALVGAF